MRLRGREYHAKTEQRSVEQHMGGIAVFLRKTARVGLVLATATVLILSAPLSAFAFGGGVHLHLAEEAINLMGVYDPHAISGTDSLGTARIAAGGQIFPWLKYPTVDMFLNQTDNGYMLSWWADNYDGYVGDFGTRSHFWEADDGLHELPEGVAGLDNAWEKAHQHWEDAVYAYWRGDPFGLWLNLGAVLHLVADMSQPAHVNSDLHPAEDSLEEWGGYWSADALLSWTDPTKSKPPKVYAVPTNQQIITKVLAASGWQPGRTEYVADAPLMDPNNAFNEPQLFYIMYRTSQSANYFASDGEGGNLQERIGWLDYTKGFPTQLHNAAGAHVPPWDETALDDNEADCVHGNPACPDGQCDCDKDLTTIAYYCYGFGMQGDMAILDLFRRTVDNILPVTTVNNVRADGKPYSAGGWNGSPVTVNLVSTFHAARPDGYNYPPVWSLWGTIDGQPMSSSTTPITTPPLSKIVSTSGRHNVAVRTTDWMGGIEQQDYVVRIDVTAPTVTFPGWRSSYFKCESQKATWTATDSHSGVQSVTAKLGGTRVLLNSTIYMYNLSYGRHIVSTTAYDKVGNRRLANRVFSVLGEVGLSVGTPSATRISRLAYSFTGTLRPTHYAGTKPVTLVLQRKQNGSWVTRYRIRAAALSSGKYFARTTLLAGSWRVRAEHYHPTKVSLYRYFTAY